MRGLLASLVIAIFFMVVALIAATFGSLGLALIGSLLHRWFDLSQWQGSLLALSVALGLGLLVYKMTQTSPQSSTWDEDWDEDEEEEEEPEEQEPPIVPWRRSRPTPGQLPIAKPSDNIKKASGPPKK